MKRKNVLKLTVLLLCLIVLLPLIASCGGDKLTGDDDGFDAIRDNQGSADGVGYEKSADGNLTEEKAPEPETIAEPEIKEAELLTAFTEPQEYEGEIFFENSENVIIKFYLSEDATKITQIDMNAVKLFLLPVDKDSIVKYTDANDALYSGAAEGYNIIDGKISSESVFIFDLTVINSCIYGMINMQIELDWGIFVTESVYIVIPNITTSYKIPSNLLE